MSVNNTNIQWIHSINWSLVWLGQPLNFFAIGGTASSWWNTGTASHLLSSSRKRIVREGKCQTFLELKRNSYHNCLALLLHSLELSSRLVFQVLCIVSLKIPLRRWHGEQKTFITHSFHVKYTPAPQTKISHMKLYSSAYYKCATYVGHCINCA